MAIVAILLSAFLYYQTHKPLEIPPQAGPVGQNVTVSQRVTAFTLLSKQYHRKGWAASFELHGNEGKDLHMYWDQINRPFVSQLIHSEQFVRDLRELGLKRLVMDNGKEQWDIDLKN